MEDEVKSIIKKDRTLPRSVLLFWIGIVIFVSFLAGFVIAIGLVRNEVRNSGYTFSITPGVLPGFDEKLYAKVYSMLQADFVDGNKIDNQKLFYGALKGMVAAVGDPYTIFFDPEALSDFNDELSGSFEGIGAEIGIKDEHLTIIAPLAQSPAERAGLRAGDIIFEIDHKDTSKMSVDEAVSQIRGKAGTSVILTVLSIGESKIPRDVTIARQKIAVPSLRSEVKDGVAIISLHSFNNDSDKLFFQALNDVRKQNIKGVILDLRNNPGGLLDKAVAIASAWIEKGQPVVREIYKDPTLNGEDNAIQQIHAPNVPTVVLVNEGSASASEILAGALQDYGVAKLVGTKTFGKGSVQDLRSLGDGSGLKVTVSRWLTPRGRLIDKEGIEPDFIVQFTQEDLVAGKDPQMDKALEIINQQQ